MASTTFNQYFNKLTYKPYLDSQYPQHTYASEPAAPIPIQQQQYQLQQQSEFVSVNSYPMMPDNSCSAWQNTYPTGMKHETRKITMSRTQVLTFVYLLIFIIRLPWVTYFWSSTRIMLTSGISIILIFLTLFNVFIIGRLGLLCWWFLCQRSLGISVSPTLYALTYLHQHYGDLYHPERPLLRPTTTTYATTATLIPKKWMLDLTCNSAHGIHGWLYLYPEQHDGAALFLRQARGSRLDLHVHSFSHRLYGHGQPHQ